LRRWLLGRAILEEWQHVSEKGQSLKVATLMMEPIGPISNNIIPVTASVGWNVL
jgi:hypothetical protein